MSFRALFYAYVLGGLTFLPLVIFAAIAYTVYTSVPIGDPDVTKPAKAALEKRNVAAAEEREPSPEPPLDVHDLPKPRRGWLTMRRTFKESSIEGSYVTLVKSFLDARSKDPKRSRPRDMWYVVLKGKVLYLYEDENMTECEAAIELSGHDIVIYPEGLLDGELYSKRNAICLKPKGGPGLPSLTREMQLMEENIEEKAEEKSGGSQKKKQKEKDRLAELEKKREAAREEALDLTTPWFIFVRSNVEMEDWYFALIHASENPANSSTLAPLRAVFSPNDMDYLVSTLDLQPDVIPMRWLNALLGRIFFSYYSTDFLESYIIGRLMKKLSKVKRPNFLTDLIVSEVDMGNKPATFSKPMLKELTKEGDAALEMHMHYKGEMRITIQAVATIHLGFKPYNVKLVLAVVLRELEGNLVVRVKRPPSNRIWYAFTQMPKMELHVEPVVSDRQITWNMILHSIESRLKEVILESIVLPNMDDIAFFDSSKYQHRGGIWPDAGRREKPSASGTTTPVADDDMSTVSAPPPQVDATLTPPSSENLTPPRDLKRSHSVGELHPDHALRPSSPTPLKHAVTAHGDTMAASSSPTPTPTTPTHHHWLTHEHSHHVSEDPEQLSDADSKAGKKHHRPHMGHLGTSRSNSSTGSDSGKKKKHFLSVRKTSRSPSPSRGPDSRPSSREPSPTPSLEKLRAGSPDTLGSHKLETSSTSSMKSLSSASQTSLLSTIKSRAGDRQALNNTAKEALRKWTVSWGKKKDQGGLSAGEEVPDAGEHRRTHDKSKHSKEKGAQKTSYAEMRAAVNERRERENGHQRRNSDAVSSPISLPNGYQKGRTASMSSQSISGSLGSIEAGGSSSSSSYTAGSDGSHTPLQETVVLRGPPSEIDIRVPSPRPGSSNGTPGSGNSVIGPTTIISPPTPVSPPLPPIQQQPSQGKTMTIPGIHASHKGQVQSMGYVAPRPPSPAPESKSMVTGVQGVYRLWKQNTSSETQDQVETKTAAEADGPSESAPAILTGEVATSPRLVPPPLPPRTPSSSPKQPSFRESPSLASATLRSIASRDAESRSPLVGDISRSSQEDLHVSTSEPASPVPGSAPTSPKPPLPPRKIQASA